MANAIWVFFLAHFRVSWTFPNLFCELVSGWWIFDLEDLPLAVWSALPSAICWGLWKERNARLFEGKQKNQVRI